MPIHLRHYAKQALKHCKYRVSSKTVSTWLFALSLASTQFQKLGHFDQIQEICYQIGTRILKIDLEIAEITKVKVGNHHLEIDILLLHRGRKKILC